ncbi:MAG: molybdenum cofactor guanylyltransferase [Bacteroidia bacterium]
MVDLYALILCGGQSHRMGIDKSLITYYDKPQRYHMDDLATAFCERGFISLATNQKNIVPPPYECIIDSDTYANTGPIGALLTAMHLYPGKNFLVLACDYPFLLARDIQQLIYSHPDSSRPTVFYNPETCFAEPLLGIYPHQCLHALEARFGKKEYSLRHFLKAADARLIVPAALASIRSIDTPEEQAEALGIINRS